MNDISYKITRACARRAFFLLAFAALAAAAQPALAQIPLDVEISLSDAPMTLDRALRTAMDQNRTVKSYDLNARAAEKKVKETRSRFGLNVKVTGDYSRVESSSMLSLPLSYYDVAPVTISGNNLYAISNPVPNVRTLDVNLNPEWQHTGQLEVVRPMFTFGKSKSATAAAGKGRDIAALDSDLARINLTAQVREMFHGAILARDVVALRQQAVERFTAHREDVQALYDSGIGIKLDVIRAETELQSAKEELTTANKNFTLAVQALKNLIGYPLDRELKLSDQGAFGVITTGSLEKYTAVALENRPELAQVRAGRDAVIMRADLEENKPMVALAGAWTFHSRGSIFNAQDSWRALLTFSMPIYDQNLAQAKTAQLKLQAQDLELKEQDLVNGIRIQVEKAYLEIEEARDRLDTSQAILKAAAEGYRIATLSYNEGFATQLDVIDAGHNLTGAGVNHAKARFDYETAKAGLALACGVYEVP